MSYYYFFIKKTEFEDKVWYTVNQTPVTISVVYQNGKIRVSELYAVNQTHVAQSIVYQNDKIPD